MGNCSSEHQTKLLSIENFSNDPTAFRVFVKKKNKFIPGWLKINDEEILFTRGGNSNSNFQFWPLAYLRRYGYTCSGIFFFESGRRCATGEGLHTFQSHQADRIFYTVQSKIKIEEYARNSRASSVVSNNRTNIINSSNNINRIHPVQRFSSEGSNNDFQRQNGSPALNYAGCPPNKRTSPSVSGTPLYETYQQNMQKKKNQFLLARNQQNIMSSSVSGIDAVNAVNGGINKRQRILSTSSAYSANAVRMNDFNYDNKKKLCSLQERPQSVVSALEHNVYNPTNNDLMFLRVPVTGAPLPLINEMSNRPYLTTNASSMFDSYTSHFPINRSLNSSFAGGGSLISANNSPCINQQQIEGEIVLEHVLSRKLHQPQLNSLIHQNYEIPSSSINVIPNTTIKPQLSQTNDLTNQKFHSYVNVNFPVGASNQIFLETLKANKNNKELHRTEKIRQDFLCSQPGGFVINSNDNGICNANYLTATSISPTINNLPTTYNSQAINENFDQHEKNNFCYLTNLNNRKSNLMFSAFQTYTNNELKNKKTYSCDINCHPPMQQFNMLTSCNSNYNNEFLNKQIAYKKNLYNTPVKMQPNYMSTIDTKQPSLQLQNYSEKNHIKNNNLINENNELPIKNDFQTNYALIDFNKTKTLERVTNMQQELRDDKKIFC